jgi:hypothetical protein
VTKLIKADAARGIGSKLVDLSDAATMAKYSIKPLLAKDATNDKRNKQAIDAIYKHGEIRPAYLMLLGSKDVIPYVSLANPAAGDGDADLPSDLPYASDKPYSQDVQDFIAPTRVVGRLPNVTNDTNPAYLIGLLQTATTYKAQPVQDYLPYLGISAEVWTKSTELSLDAIFGSHTKMKISPPDGPKWTAAEAKPLAHFINCHGAAGDPNYYGQKGASYPVAHEASWMASKVVPGTVLAAEMLLRCRALRSGRSHRRRPDADVQHVSGKQGVRVFRQHEHCIRPDGRQRPSGLDVPVFRDQSWERCFLRPRLSAGTAQLCLGKRECAHTY